MAYKSDSSDEAELIGRSLTGIVDIGSNGIRFSISSKADHHARIMPCVFKDRIGISLFDVQYARGSTKKRPIPQETITDVVNAMRRFKLVCEDFGVPHSSVRVVATEATREAINSEQFRDAIKESTGWEVRLLDKKEEGRLGSLGVTSGFNSLNGLFMDLGGGSTQLSWIITENGEFKMSPEPVSLPYGAAALTKRAQFEDKKQLFFEIKEAYKEAFEKIKIPEKLVKIAEKNGGFDLYTCGGGLRGIGYALLSDIPNYPIPTIINGFSCSFNDFMNLANLMFLKENPLGTDTAIFRVSERRRSQFPAAGLLISAAFDSFTNIKTVHFSEGGVREGVLYSSLSQHIRAQDPLIIASRPYAPLLAEKYLALLKTALPAKYVPRQVRERIAPALCNLAFVHASYPKELQPTAALHVATTGIIAGSYGLSHQTRALIGIALCDRWGGDLPKSEEQYKNQLCQLVKRDGNKLEMERIVWWTKYCGTIMFVICGVHPGGNIRDGVFNFKIDDVNNDENTDNSSTKNTGDSGTLKENGGDNDNNNDNHVDRSDSKKLNDDEKRKFDVTVQISNKKMKMSASVRGRIYTLQKKIRKLSKGSSEKVKIAVEVYDDEG